MPIQDDCNQRFDEIQKTLYGAQAQWKELVESLVNDEANFLEARLDCWKRWFGLAQDDLAIWIEGGIRWTVRARLQALLVKPLEDRMRKRVDFEYIPEEDESNTLEEALSAQSSNHILASVLLFFERRIKPIVLAAKKEDDALGKKIKKTEKDERSKGIVALSGDTKKVAALKRERALNWETPLKELEALVAPVLKVGAFFADELSPEIVEGLAASVPALVCRTLCDWHYEKCLVDFDQLDTWWAEVNAKLRPRDVLWEAILEKEGYLIRRIDQGMEELRLRKNRYSTYATFGGNEMEIMKWMASPSHAALGDNNAGKLVVGAMPTKLEDSVNLLATVVSDMQQRIRAMRDSALWRIIDTAQEIHRQQKAAELVSDKPPWQLILAGEGLIALFARLQEGEEETSMMTVITSDDEVIDAALLVMSRLERFGVVVQEITEFFQRTPLLSGADRVCSILTESAACAAEVNEELLALLDDPSLAAASMWLNEQYVRLECSEAGCRLEASCSQLPLLPDAELATVDERKERREWLVLARGLQAFLSDAAVRNQLVAPLGASVLAEPISVLAEPPFSSDFDENDVLELATPPVARKMAVSQDTKYSYRPPDRPSPRGDQRVPQTPPAGAEEDGTPKSVSKFIDGHLVAMRASATNTTLPPISPAGGKLSRTKPMPGGGGGAL